MLLRRRPDVKFEIRTIVVRIQVFCRGCRGTTVVA